MKINKILASLLALVMVLGTMGTVVFAEEYKLPVADYQAITGDALDVYDTGVALLDFGGTFAVKDMADYVTTEDYNYYRLNPVDFEVTFSNSGHALLLGQYEFFDEMWIPATDIFSGGKGDLVYFEANKPFRVMDEGTGGAFKDFITLKQICEEIKVFNCGVMFADMPAGTTATLDLCMYDRNTGEKIATFGSYKYEGYTAKKDYAVCINMGDPFGNVEFPLQAKSVKQIMSLLDDPTNDLADTYTIKLYDDVTVSEAFNVPDVEDITVDLNGKTLNVAAGDNVINGNIKFINGTIDVSETQNDGDSIFMVKGATSEVVFENVNLIGDGYKSPNGVIYMKGSVLARATGQGVEFINSNVDLKNEQATSTGAFINSTGGNVDIINTTINLYKSRAGFVNADVNLKESTYVVDQNEHAFDNLSLLTVDNSSIKVANSTDSGMKIGTGSVNVKGDSKVAITGSVNGDITHRSDVAEDYRGTISIDGTAELAVDNAAGSVIDKITSGNIVNKTEKIAVAFVKDEDDLTGRTYKIVLKGAEGKTINDFESAHFTFVNNKKNIGYTITPNTGANITAVDDISNPDRISFYMNAGVKEPIEITADEIVLGTVRFEGYGDIDFSIDTIDAKVNATTIYDNIVETFTPDSATNILYVNWTDANTTDKYLSSIVGEDFFTEQKRNLKVTISFNNDITSQSADYTEMAVEVTGQNGEKHLGLVGDTASVKYDAEMVCATVETDGNTVTIPFTVTAGYRYTVKLTGAGYRTTEYTTVIPALTPEELATDTGITLNFWNNVKDEFNKTEIEEESGRYFTKNFLAGEIVQDNKINKYDLAAVVSYFGEDNLVTSRPGYNKYDLNRDGVIDSEDIAYVLVSFGE